MNKLSFPKTETFDSAVVRAKIMGPNPLKICEELLCGGAPGGASSAVPGGASSAAPGGAACCIAPGGAACCIAPGGAKIESGLRVCDLGSGMGITSVMLAREFGLDTYAVDLWSDPDENREFFREMGVPDEMIHPVKADASEGLPFEVEFFDAVVSIDSYNYYGRDPEYLGNKLLPYVKPGGRLYLAIPGMQKDCHDDLPSCLLKSWTPEQLEYMHDASWWRAMIEQTSGVRIVSIEPMACTNEAWADWLECDNEYAQGDRASVEAGALDYLNTLAIVLEKLG